MDHGTRTTTAPAVLGGPGEEQPVGFLRLPATSLIRGSRTVHRLVAFALITLGVAVTKINVARTVIRPLLRKQLFRSGLRLLPMITFFGLALGLVIVGQTVFILNRVGARGYVGVVMVSVVIRELGPLLTALLVLMRSGTASVVELGTSRALGEVEALEALAIDPIHYLVLPRLWGTAVAVFALTVYLILSTLASGYLFVFLQDIPLSPGEYLRQLADALGLIDFVILGSKSILFGISCAIITCYHGLARPLRLGEVSSATVRAVAQSAISCIVIDALFITIYWVL